MPEPLITGAATHVGLVRANNEDSYALIGNQGAFQCALILADGMGGHSHGELASKIATDYVREQLDELARQDVLPEDLPGRLKDVTEKANVKVYLGSLEDDDNHGMGTTLTIAVIQPGILVLAHIGDCRAYLLHDGELIQLTVDHTLVQEMVDAGSLDPAESIGHPRRNILTRALGVPEYLQPDISTHEIVSGDKILLCSDGLHGFVSEDSIKKTMITENNPDHMADALIRLALDAGGEDNITVLSATIE